MRHAARDESRLERGCRNDDGEAGGRGVGAASPPLLQFEQLFLWATGETGTVETVQGKFGGADVVRRYARRRSGRSACMGIMTLGRTTETMIYTFGGERGGHLRAKQRSVAMSSVFPEQAARVCLESHLKEYTQDVRAAFALEMVLQAIGGNGVDRQVTRLREKVCAKSGRAGTWLWRYLHARAADAAVTGTIV